MRYRAAANEIVEHVLLTSQCALPVPFFAVFAAAPQICNDVDATPVKPQPPVRPEEARRQRNAVTAITVEQHWVRLIELRAHLADDRDGNFCPVLRGRKRPDDLGIVELDRARLC